MKLRMALEAAKHREEFEVSDFRFPRKVVFAQMDRYLKKSHSERFDAFINDLVLGKIQLESFNSHMTLSGPICKSFMNVRQTSWAGSPKISRIWAVSQELGKVWAGLGKLWKRFHYYSLFRYLAYRLVTLWGGFSGEVRSARCLSCTSR